jgi:hypothetical protein
MLSTTSGPFPLGDSSILGPNQVYMTGDNSSIEGNASSSPRSPNGGSSFFYSFPSISHSGDISSPATRCFVLNEQANALYDWFVDIFYTKDKDINSRYLDPDAPI